MWLVAVLEASPGTQLTLAEVIVVASISHSAWAIFAVFAQSFIDHTDCQNAFNLPASAVSQSVS